MSTPIKYLNGIDPSTWRNAHIDTSWSQLLSGANSGTTSSAPSNPPSKSASVGAAAATAIVTGLINMWLNSRNNRSNRELVDVQNAQNMESWREQTSYNTPSNQIARMQLAGLNPALMYGSPTGGGIADPAPESHASHNLPSMLNLDPLTLAQVKNLDAQTESIEHQTQREDDKHPITIEQLGATLSETRSRVNEIQQSIANMKFDEQIKSQVYLKNSLDYMFQQATFSDAVKKFHEDLRASSIGNRYTEVQVDRAIKLLSFELLGFKVNQDNVRSLTDLNLQQYNQSRELFEYVKQKAKAEGKVAEYNSSDEFLGFTKRSLQADTGLKELDFWINARNNVLAFENYISDYDKKSLLSPFNRFIMEFADIFNHGLKLPISFRF